MKAALVALTVLRGIGLGLGAGATLCAAAQGVQVVSVPGGLMRVPDAAAISTTSPASEAKPAWRMVSRPAGIERVIDSAPASAMAKAAAPAMSSRFVNGVSERVLPGNTTPATATDTARSSAWVEEVLPNGARRLNPPTSSTAQPAVSAHRFVVVDIDATGRTSPPAEAMRNDVLLRVAPAEGASR